MEDKDTNPFPTLGIVKALWVLGPDILFRFSANTVRLLELTKEDCDTLGLCELERTMLDIW